MVSLHMFTIEVCRFNKGTPIQTETPYFRDPFPERGVDPKCYNPYYGDPFWETLNHGLHAAAHLDLRGLPHRNKPQEVGREGMIGAVN